MLLITGESGIGKTRMVEELAALAAGGRTAGGAAQLRSGTRRRRWGRPWPTGRSWRHCESGPPGCSPTSSRATWPSPATASSSGCWACSPTWLAQAPLVLALEDLHWADESSHELLAFLAVRLRDARVLVVATLRDEDLTKRPGAGSPTSSAASG